MECVVKGAPIDVPDVLLRQSSLVQPILLFLIVAPKLCHS